MLVVAGLALLIAFCLTPLWLDWIDRAMDRLLDDTEAEDVGR